MDVFLKHARIQEAQLLSLTLKRKHADAPQSTEILEYAV